MQMTMRWYGSQYDTVTLQQIRQTAYVKGVISTLYNKMPGELWTYEEIMALKNEVEAAGLTLPGIESVNISDATKRELQSVTKILMHISRHLRILVRLIFIWYVIISCQYLTGLVQSLHV